MVQAIKHAKKSIRYGEVPVGAVIVYNDTIISVAHNEVQSKNNPTFHAEMLAINKACKLVDNRYLDEMDIYVTLEPCAMCAHAISLARMRNVFFALEDKKSGGVYNGAKVFEHSLWRPCLYEGFCVDEVKDMMQKFFRSIR